MKRLTTLRPPDSILDTAALRGCRHSVPAPPV
jgi:hypothetical protein